MPEATVTAAILGVRTPAIHVRAAGLPDRRLDDDTAKIVLTRRAFAAGAGAFVTLGRSWATLGVAVLLDVLSTQLGFLGLDAWHRQFFRSRRAEAPTQWPLAVIRRWVMVSCMTPARS